MPVPEGQLDELRSQVAQLRGDLDDSVKMASRFRSEIRLARKVSSPHICRIYEYGEDGALRYISMEYVDGVTLRDLVHESGGLPVDVALVSYEPGVVDTEMQQAVRGALASAFPHVKRFLDLHAQGELHPPSRPAAEIADLLESDGLPPFSERRLGGR